MKEWHVYKFCEVINMLLFLSKWHEKFVVPFVKVISMLIFLMR